MTDTSTKQIASQVSLNYIMPENKKEAWDLLNSLDKSKIYALDFETTALNPSEGEVRLTSIYGHGKWYLIDHFQCGAFVEFAEWFSERTWIVFNACFEGKWIDYYALNSDVVLLDVQFMRAAALGGAPMMKLSYMLEKDLKIKANKDEQNSNWAAEILTIDQLDYAALDSRYNMQLYQHWIEQLTPGQYKGFMFINEAWRANVEMEQTGLQLDVEYHSQLVKLWLIKKYTSYNYMRRWTTEAHIENLNSNIQIGNFLVGELPDEVVRQWPVTGKTKQLDLSNDVLKQSAFRFPYPMGRWFAALLIYRKYSKLISTYGHKMIEAQQRLGRVPSRFNMARAITGRYSSSAFNLQNIPRAKVIRRSFITPYRGGGVVVKLVMADYSSIEVRVLAEVSRDEQLLFDAIYGDVHSRSASQIFDIDFEYFCEVIASKGEGKYANVFADFSSKRSRSKAFTFQLLYGAGAAALALALKCTDEEAYAAIDAWSTLYPKAYHYRTTMYEQMRHSGYLPVIDGRTIYVPYLDRTMPVAANYPIQGAAASVMYRALKHTHDNLLDNPAVPARIAATVHDEILMFAREQYAEQAGVLLINGMVDGWLDVFPGTNTDNLCGKGNKATVGASWAEKA